MPDQNTSNDPTVNPVQGSRPVLTTEEVPATTTPPTQDPNQPTTQVPSPIPETTDVPPPPTDTPGAALTDTTSSPNPTPGSSSPNFDLPPMVGAPPRKKFGGKRVISTILGLLLLVGGIGVGVSLVKQQQNPEERAKAPTEKELCVGCATNGEKWVWVNGECKKRAADECKEKETPNPNLKVCTGYSGGPCQKGQRAGEACGDGGTCVMTNTQTGACECQGGRQATNPPSTPGPSAQCSNVKAYDTNNVLLTQDQLKALKAGDKVRFAVAGTTTGGGSFDKAKFKINATDSGEVTTKNANGEFYYEFTIPAGTTSFNIAAQIHHTTLGWSN